jgi:hypothetical protein
LKNSGVSLLPEIVFLKLTAYGLSPFFGGAVDAFAGDDE